MSTSTQDTAAAAAAVLQPQSGGDVAAATSAAAAAASKEAAAARKKAKAKAKKARKRAKAKAAKAAAFIAAETHSGSRPGYVFRHGTRGTGYYQDDGGAAAPAGVGFVNHARRGPAGKGRGHGLFATTAVPKGGVIVRARPALSTVFDQYVASVCAFCFRTADNSAATATAAAAAPAAAVTAAVEKHTLRLRKDDAGRLGVFVDERKPDVGGLLPPVAVLNGCAPGSANATAGIQPGDIVDSVAGSVVAPGAGVLQRCLATLAAAPAGPAGFDVVVVRPATTRGTDAAAAGTDSSGLQVCEACRRCATCAACRAEGRLEWHRAHECDLFRALPPAARLGETSPIRMMLRYRATADGGDWAGTCPVPEPFAASNHLDDVPAAGRAIESGGEPPTAPAAAVDAAAATAAGEKEPLELVATLQANKDALQPAHKSQFAAVTGVSPAVVAQIVGQIRGNACAVLRDRYKVGCALSVFMGYSNHDCDPNAEATVDEEGFVTLCALSDVPAGGEVCISYVDRTAPVEQRRAILKDHYEFECKCTRCVREHREFLRSRARSRGAAYVQNNSSLARNSYVHSMGGGGGASGGVARGSSSN